MQERTTFLNTDKNIHANPNITKYIKYGFIYFAIIFFIASFIIGLGIYNILSYSKIYQGVYIGDVYVGGESKISAIEKIARAYDSAFDEQSITIEGRDTATKVNYKDIDVHYDLQAAITEALNIGKDGNAVNRLMFIASLKKNNTIIPLEIKTNQEKLSKIIKTLADKTDIPMKENEIQIDEDRLKIIKGMQGEHINIEKAVQQVLDVIRGNNETTITLQYEIIDLKPLDVDELYNKIYVEPVNAYYEVEDYRLKIVPHITGVKFDKTEAEKILKENQTKKELDIPLIFTNPEVTEEILKQQPFKDKLSSYSTSFDSKLKSRSHNIALAASKINGVVLGPNDIFSYNDVVGERSIDTGYQTAPVYVGDRIVDGIGGGICQVSSTLYNVVLFSDLQVINRTYHSMPVGYVPLGQDATVSYGVLDFAFSNNTSSPIKIVSYTDIEKGKLTFEIYGTKENIQKSIEIENVTISTVPFPVEYIDDPNLEKGKTVIKQYGTNGYVVNTYKIIKEDGKIVSKDLITKSNYRPIKQIELKGTKEPDIPTALEVENEILPDEQSESKQTDLQQQKPSEVDKPLSMADI